MNLIFLLFSIQVVWGEKWAFYHELSVKTFQPPTTLREDSYFGYSTAYDWYNKRLFISAPRANNIGDVYECDLSGVNKNCANTTRNIPREVPNYKHDYWFGATMKAGPSYIMVCTPRYTRMALGYKDAGTFGRCYRREMNGVEFGSPKYPTTPSGAPLYIHQELIMDTLGWSLDITDDGDMIVGGPGLFHKIGTVGILGAKLNLLKRIQYAKPDIFNFGYSVAIGYFTNEAKVSYAISTTYGNNGFGQVYFYHSISDKSPLTLNKKVDTDVIGSMFGAVLCTAKMNNSPKNISDLLVGAPTYASQSGYNTGAVYVYGYHRRGSLPTYRNKIVGQKPGSRFGSAIIRIGDLNDDGSDEIAIGAPFEDDGAVYLYSGADLLSDKPFTWLQRIKPSGTNMKSFGYSLAALKDYDENGCNELAISAPYKDTVMLYTCLAAVTINKLYTNFPNVKNRTLSHQTDFVFQVCMDVKYPEKPRDIIGDLSTEVTLEHPYARLKNPDHNNVYTFKTHLQTKQPTYCENVNFILPLDKDYSLEIRYKIQSKLLNHPMELTKVTGAHVILSDHSELSYSDAFWAGECPGADECISNLSLTITSDLTKPFITGSLATGKFHISVLNTGEVAYDPCIQFNIKGAGLQITPLYCTNDKNLEETWKCNTMAPIKTNATWEIKDITVDLQGLTNQDKEVALNVKLFERCANPNNSTSYTHNIPLKSISDGVSIKGSTNVGDIVQILEKDISLSKHFEQIYTIINRGPSNFKGLTCTIRLQKTEFITYSKAPVSIRIDATTKSKEIYKICRINTDNDDEIVATCVIDSLFKENHVQVMISLDTNPDVLTYNKLKNEDNLEVKSTLTIQFDEDNPKSFSLTTSVRLREAYVALWIWIVAGLVGLLLIIILTCVLYKYGFLQRENKKKLASLKQDIKRQSVRQSTKRPPTGDTNQILENMEEADESAGAVNGVQPKQNDCAPSTNNEKAPK